MRRQRGVTLLEMLVAVSILGVVVVAGVGGVSTLLAQMRVESAKSAMHMLAMRIRDDLGNADHLRTSADHDGGNTNKDFWKCVSTTEKCVATDARNRKGFALYRVQKAAGGSAFHQKVVGTKGAPVYYDLRGEQCYKPADDGCLFMTYAEFWATCPLNSSGVPETVCTPAEILNFTFAVEVIDSNTLPSYYKALGGARYPPKPSGSGADYDIGFVVRQAAAPIIQKATTEACGAGQIQDGILENGLPRCRCAGSLDVVSPTTVCKNACEDKKVLTGFDNLGKVQCADLKDCAFDVKSCAEFLASKDKCPCECIDLVENKMVNCSPGYWITGVETGDCKANDTGKKGGNEPIHCTGGFMICCSASSK